METYKPHIGDKIVRVHLSNKKKIVLWTYVFKRYPETGEIITNPYSNIEYKIVEAIRRIDYSIDLYVKKEREIKVNQYK